MTKEDTAKCQRIRRAVKDAFSAIPPEMLDEIINAIEDGPIIGGSIYTPKWLYDAAWMSQPKKIGTTL